MASAKKKGLGRGLSALISSSTASERTASKKNAAPVTLSDGSTLLELDPKSIQPNPNQPRQFFEEAQLQELADSITHDGVQEPVLVRKQNGVYQLISGERRVRASVLAGVKTVPAVCREVSDDDMLRLGIIENVQREDLNPIELALAYQSLADTFDWTQDEIARQVGKKRATVTNTLRLLNLTDAGREALVSGAITMGHAKALLSHELDSDQDRACTMIVSQGLSVRQAERLSFDDAPSGGIKTVPTPDPHVLEVEDKLRRALGTKVHLKTASPTRGRIEIEYHDLDELERLMAILEH